MDFSKKKGKEGTRGARQIAKENLETISFYRNMILGANGICFAGMTLLRAHYQMTEICCFLVCAVISIGGCQFLSRLGQPTYSSTEANTSSTLIDPGLDLNMENGMAEHIKDAIILTSGVQLLAIFSNYCWLLLLLGPFRAFTLLWTNLISPWIFAEPENENVDEKKQKKLERRMKRVQ